MRTPFPDFAVERSHGDDSLFAIGVDEVGRGCLAGPVYVGGVCFGPLTPPRRRDVLKLGIHDSKQLTARTRESLCDPIRTHARAWAIESGSVEEINSDGIVTAIERAVIRVVDTIVNTLAPDTRILVLTDSLPVRRLTRYPQQAVPHGDATCVCIAAASVIAKVARDRHMSELHTIHPHYAWNMNKGYATRTHRSAIQQHGPSPLHRLLFIRNILST